MTVNEILQITPKEESSIRYHTARDGVVYSIHVSNYKKSGRILVSIMAMSPVAGMLYYYVGPLDELRIYELPDERSKLSDFHPQLEVHDLYVPTKGWKNTR